MIRDYLLSPVALPLLLFTIGCHDQTRPNDGGGVLTDPPDLTVVVLQAKRQSGVTPIGYLTQYELWIGSPGSASPEAGLVLGEKAPIYRRAGDRLVPTAAAGIQVGTSSRCGVSRAWRTAQFRLRQGNRATEPCRWSSSNLNGS